MRRRARTPPSRRAGSDGLPVMRTGEPISCASLPAFLDVAARRDVLRVHFESSREKAGWRGSQQGGEGAQRAK
ncbi:hypothetical protein MRX96_000621 [Rhipicephalus microplus]